MYFFIVQGIKEEIDYIHYFCGESGVDLGEDEAFARSRERLYKLVSRLVRAYAEIKHDMDAAGYSAERQSEIAGKAKFYIDLKAMIGKASGDSIDLKLFEPGIRHLIDNYIIAEDVRPFGSFDAFTLLDFIIAQEGKLKSEGRGSAAEAIENNIRKKVVERLLVNPKYY